MFPICISEYCSRVLWPFKMLTIRNSSYGDSRDCRWSHLLLTTSELAGHFQSCRLSKFIFWLDSRNRLASLPTCFRAWVDLSHVSLSKCACFFAASKGLYLEHSRVNCSVHYIIKQSVDDWSVSLFCGKVWFGMSCLFVIWFFGQRRRVS